MPTSKEAASASRARGEPVRGWVEEGNGWFSAPGNLAGIENPKTGDNIPSLTKDYSDFAERQRARHDLVHYVKTVIKQRHLRKSQ